MEPTPPPWDEGDAWSDQFARAITAGRSRAFELLEQQERRINGLEAELNAGAQQFAAERERSHDPAERQALELRGIELARREAELDEREADLTANQTALDVQRGELDRREAALATGERSRARAEQTVDEDRRELALARSRLDRERDTLLAERAELSARLSASALQRRRIARKLKTEWRAQRETIRRRKLELEQLLAAEQEHQQSTLAAARAEVDALRQQKARLVEQLRRRAAEARRLRRAHEQLGGETSRNDTALRSEGHAGPAGDPPARGLLPDTQGGDSRAGSDDRNTLERKLAIAERQLAEIDAIHDAQERKFDELQRRFEMAVSELRAYKQRVVELEERLGPEEAQELEGPQDWESRKQRLLDSLENEVACPETYQARATIEGTIRITDEVIAQKDREIAELKMLLDQQSQNIGAVAVGASAFAAVLDGDELVRQERERLEQLQNEWRDKVRQGEIEISLERARLARVQAELEDRFLHAPAGQPIRERPIESAANPAKPGNGRWRAFMGLKERDDSDS